MSSSSPRGGLGAGGRFERGVILPRTIRFRIVEPVETTESNEIGTRRPLKIAAPLLLVVGALSDAVAAEATCAILLGRDVGDAAKAVGVAIGALLVALSAHQVVRPGQTVVGLKRLLLFLSGVAGLGAGLIATMPESISTSSVVATLAFCVAVWVGSLTGARVGAVLDRQGEFAGESADADEQP